MVFQMLQAERGHSQLGGVEWPRGFVYIYIYISIYNIYIIYIYIYIE